MIEYGPKGTCYTPRHPLRTHFPQNPSECQRAACCSPRRFSLTGIGGCAPAKERGSLTNEKTSSTSRRTEQVMSVARDLHNLAAACPTIFVRCGQSNAVSGDCARHVIELSACSSIPRQRVFVGVERIIASIRGSFCLCCSFAALAATALPGLVWFKPQRTYHRLRGKADLLHLPLFCGIGASPGVPRALDVPLPVDKRNFQVCSRARIRAAECSQLKHEA